MCALRRGTPEHLIWISQSPGQCAYVQIGMCACVCVCMHVCVYSSGEQRLNVCYTPASLGGTSTDPVHAHLCNPAQDGRVSAGRFPYKSGFTWWWESWG